MRRLKFMLLGLLILGFVSAAAAADRQTLEALLKKPINDPGLTFREVQSFAERGVPRVPAVRSADAWRRLDREIRRQVLDNVVFRGQAAFWRDAETRVEWLDAIEGGPGYRIKKLRYEALPGLWIPALLYEPETIPAKAAVMLNVNGHDAKGKAALYKQIRCINQAKRGMLALNVEWLGMGQLRSDNFAHGRMNQLDLCGTSGVAPFFLAMKRGLDVLLSLEHADPSRVAVAGLSGGGWQTIIISSLDSRVTLANPVAGYSGFRTRVRNHSDLGDSEQTPVDLAMFADYDHLTAIMAPRPLLLTYNAEDDCCFKADHALSPLLEAAGPVYRLFAKEHYLRAHVNTVPGNHNFERDNREALYRMLSDHGFFAPSASAAGGRTDDANEIPSDVEVKSQEELAVEIPAENANFNSLALAIAKSLPRQTDLPSDRTSAEAWQTAAQQELSGIVRSSRYDVRAERIGSEDASSIKATFWRLYLGDDWTVPGVELVPEGAKGTTIVVSDGGRAGCASEIEQLLAKGQRVLAVDLFYFGESAIQERGYLFALLVSAIGKRPLGVQADQLAAVARWVSEEPARGPASVLAIGPRSCLIATTAAALEAKAIGGVELSGSMGSLKEVIEENRTVEQAPELFCFGLLERFDVKHLVALVAPRPVKFNDASDRVKTEMAPLKKWFALLGAEFELP